MTHEGERVEWEEAISQVERRFEELVGSAAVGWNDRSELPKAGVYVFYKTIDDGEEPLYVGRSRRLRDRIREHGAESSDRFNASFALLLARESTEDTVDQNLPAAALMNVQEFRAAFEAGKLRIRGMQVRAVKVQDDILQTLLEIYASRKLGTPYNSFRTH